MTQSLLHAGEHRLVIARLHIDDPVRDESCLCERRREEVGPADAPENLPGRARCDAGHEQRCRGTVDSAMTAAGNFMQGATRQAAARKTQVQLGDPERKH